MKIETYFLRKCATLALSFLAIVTVAFFLMRITPGDPFQYEQALPEEIQRQLQEQHGLHVPAISQYFRYIQQLLVLDLGNSLIYHDRDVVGMISSSFPTSALLGLEALLFCIPMGLLLGMAAALTQRGWITQSFLFFIVVLLSIPGFILATGLQYVFGIQLGWLPIAQWSGFSYSILPVLSLAAMPMAFIARMVFTRAQEELEQGYVITARAKGLPPGYIIRKHVLRNVLIPVLGYMAPLMANILTGSFIVEKIFAIPGLGFWFVTSVLNRDYPLIMGITVFYCALILIITLCVDIIAAWVDPRLQNARGSE